MGMVIQLEVTQLITISDAAKQLRLSRQSIYKMIRKGRLTPVVIGGVKFLFESEIEKVRRGT